MKNIVRILLSRRERELLQLKDWMERNNYRGFDRLWWKDYGAQLVDIYVGETVVQTVRCSEVTGTFKLYYRDSDREFTPGSLKGVITGHRLRG